MGPTKPTETYFFRGVWGWASTTWAKINALSNLLGVALHGYDGSAWQKLALVWGYTDVYGDNLSATSDGTSPTTVKGAVVPAGEVWKVTNIVARHADTVNRTVGINAVVGGATVLLGADTSLAPWALLPWENQVWLKEDDYIESYVTSLANTKVAYLAIAGYKMAVS